MSRPDADPEPACPRCGYDVSGAAAAWKRACDLVGTCPECGLRFQWADLLGQRRKHFRLVENTNMPFGSTFRTTLLAALRPARFWHCLEMTQPPVWRRIWMYAMLAWAIIILLGGFFDIIADLLFGALGAFLPFSMSWYAVSPDPLDGIVAAVGNALTPFGLVLFLPWPGYAPRVMWDLLWVPAFIAACPLGYLLLPATLGRLRVRKRHLSRAFLYGWPWAMLWAEVAYLFAFAIAESRDRLWWASLHWLSRYAVSTGLLWIVLLLVSQWIWWSAVNRHYLRLPQPRLVTASMLAVVGLAILVLMFGLSSTGARLLFDLEGA